MNVHVHVEWLQECYEYGTNYRTLGPLFRALFICPALQSVCVVTGSPSTSSSLMMSWCGHDRW